MNQQIVLILDFGGQYTQLIARRVREANVYCEILPFDATSKAIKDLNPRAIILSGGAASINDNKAPKLNEDIYDLNIPMLGICYGMQLMAGQLGGEVSPCSTREYGSTRLFVEDKIGRASCRERVYI